MISGMNAIANLVGVIGDSQFDQHFYDFCRSVLHVDQCLVFHFDAKGQPQCLLAEAQYSQSRNVVRTLAKEYTDGAYQRDPNLVASPPRAMLENDIVVQRVSPSQIRDLGYRRRFYDEAMVRQEMAMLTSVNNQTLYCSFLRSEDHRDFTSDDASQLQQLGNFLTQTLVKHAEVIQLRESNGSSMPEPATLSPERRERMYQDLRAALLRAPGGLTQREAEVCAAIALGYTTLGIGLNLGISTNTVATHRKRAYAKLGISCQNELFARYFDSMGGSRTLN